MGKQNNQNQSTQQQGDQDVQDKDKLAGAGAIEDAQQGGEASGDQSGAQSNGESGGNSEGSEGAGNSDAGEDAAALAALAAVGQQGQGGEGSQEPDAPINDAPETPAPVAQGNTATVADAPDNTPAPTPGARAQSVTLNPIPVKVDVKTQQDNLKLSIIAANLEEYAKLMAPNVSMNPVDGKTNQTNLWRTIQMVLNLEGPEFIKGYTMLLDWVAENRAGALSEKFVYRYFADLTIPNVDRKNFNRMLNLLTATADPATRRLGLEQVDLTASLADFRNGAIQQRVTEFYSL